MKNLFQKVILLSILILNFILLLFIFKNFLPLQASLIHSPSLDISKKLDQISKKLDEISQKIEKKNFNKILAPISEEISKLKEEIERSNKGEIEEIEFCKIPEIFKPERKIIINEICWMGDKNSFANEWIEIKNISKEKIDLSGWQILSENIQFLFPKNSEILPGQILLLKRESSEIENFNFVFKGAIKNEEERIFLFDKNCKLQDFAMANPKWEAGDNETKQTMERKPDLSWQNSKDPGGTPKRENSILDKIEKAEIKKLPKVSLSFPKEVFLDEEFEVLILVTDLESKKYDLKISVEYEGKNLSKILDPIEKNWQSSSYYLKEIFIGPEFSGKFKLKISSQEIFGDVNLISKIRDSQTQKIVAEISERIKILQKQISITQPSPQKECIDINTASKEELEKLYGVGPTIAQRIIEARPFSSVDDLIRVKGIGEKILQKIKEQGLACVK